MSGTSSPQDQTTTSIEAKHVLVVHYLDGTQSTHFSSSSADVRNAVANAKNKETVLGLDIYTLESSMKKVTTWQ